MKNREQYLHHVIFPFVEIDGERMPALPIPEIRSQKDEDLALDLIDEMKRREGKEFHKNGSHLKVNRTR